MSEKKHLERQSGKKDFAFGISFGEFLISMATGLVSGIATGTRTVWDKFKTDAREATVFKKHFDERITRLNEIKRRNFDKPSDYWTAISKEKVAIQKEFNQIALEKRGVTSGLVKGTYGRFRLLSPSSRSQLYFNGAVGAAIGTAMTLSFFNGVATRDKIEKIADVTGADNEISR